MLLFKMPYKTIHAKKVVSGWTKSNNIENHRPSNIDINEFSCVWYVKMLCTPRNSNVQLSFWPANSEQSHLMWSCGTSYSVYECVNILLSSCAYPCSCFVFLFALRDNLFSTRMVYIWLYALFKAPHRY